MKILITAASCGGSAALPLAIEFGPNPAGRETGKARVFSGSHCSHPDFSGSRCSHPDTCVFSGSHCSHPDFSGSHCSHPDTCVFSGSHCSHPDTCAPSQRRLSATQPRP